MDPTISPTPGAQSAAPRGPQRADARRNHDLILDTAREAFAADGATVSMAEVARRAGVGMATLYRNFPNRLALLEALYLENVLELARSADDLAGAAPLDALTTWLRDFARYFAAKQALAAELLDHVSVDETQVFTTSRQAITDAVGGLLASAQQAGEVRADITTEEVLDLVVGIAKIPSTDPGHVDRILAIAFDGLRVSARET